MTKSERSIVGKFVDYLAPDEQVVELIGKVNYSPNNGPNLPGYAAVSSQRLIVVKRGFGRKSTSVELSKIVQITVNNGPYFSTLTLYPAGGPSLVFTLFPPDKVPALKAAVEVARNRPVD